MSPEEAFAVLGEKTRLEVLRVLGAADGPLSFSELFERVEYDDSSNFSYHLGKLRGHFVRESEAGYELRQPGARVVGALLSGAINETPTIDRVFERAEAWGMSRLLLSASGVCPRCTAPVERTLRVCSEHDDTADTGPHCGRNYAVMVDTSCTTCPHEGGGLIAHYILPNVEFLSFLTPNGVNPVAPMLEFYQTLIDHEEEVVSTDPFEARLTFETEDDAITVTVDEDLSVIDVARQDPTERERGPRPVHDGG